MSMRVGPRIPSPSRAPSARTTAPPPGLRAHDSARPARHTAHGKPCSRVHIDLRAAHVPYQPRTCCTLMHFPHAPSPHWAHASDQAGERPSVPIPSGGGGGGGMPAAASPHAECLPVTSRGRSPCQWWPPQAPTGPHTAKAIRAFSVWIRGDNGGAAERPGTQKRVSVALLPAGMCVWVRVRWPVCGVTVPAFGQRRGCDCSATRHSAACVAVPCDTACVAVLVASRAVSGALRLKRTRPDSACMALSVLRGCVVCLRGE